MKNRTLLAAASLVFIASLSARAARLSDFRGEYHAEGKCKIRTASVTVDKKGAPSIAVNLFERPGAHPEFGNMPTFGESFFNGAVFTVNNSYQEGQSVTVNGSTLVAETFFLNPKEVHSRVVLQLTGSGVRIQWPGGTCSFVRDRSSWDSFGGFFSSLVGGKAPEAAAVNHEEGDSPEMASLPVN